MTSRQDHSAGAHFATATIFFCIAIGANAVRNLSQMASKPSPVSVDRAPEPSDPFLMLVGGFFAIVVACAFVAEFLLRPRSL